MLYSTIGRRALPACTCQPQLHAAAAVPSRLRTLATTRFARNGSRGTATAVTSAARPPDANAAGAPIPRVQASRTPATPFTPPAVTTQDLERLSRPAPWQRGAQALGFVLSGLTGAYAVLFYDFGDRDHCFRGIRQRFQGLQDQFFTVSEQDRQLRRSTSKDSKDSSTAPVTATKERLV